MLQYCNVTTWRNRLERGKKNREINFFHTISSSCDIFELSIVAICKTIHNEKKRTDFKHAWKLTFHWLYTFCRILHRPIHLRLHWWHSMQLLVAFLCWTRQAVQLWIGLFPSIVSNLHPAILSNEEFSSEKYFFLNLLAFIDLHLLLWHYLN